MTAADRAVLVLVAIDLVLIVAAFAVGAMWGHRLGERKNFHDRR